MGAAVVRELSYSAGERGAGAGAGQQQGQHTVGGEGFHYPSSWPN